MCPISVRPSNLFVSVYVTFFFLEINVKEYRKGGKSRESGNIRYTRRKQTHTNTTQYVSDTTIHK